MVFLQTVNAPQQKLNFLSFGENKWN